MEMILLVNKATSHGCSNDQLLATPWLVLPPTTSNLSVLEPQPLKIATPMPTNKITPNAKYNNPEMRLMSKMFLSLNFLPI